MDYPDLIAQSIQLFRSHNVLNMPDSVEKRELHCLPELFKLVGKLTRLDHQENQYYVSLEDYDLKAQYPFNSDLKYRWPLLLRALHPLDGDESLLSWYARMQDTYAMFGFTSFASGHIVVDEAFLNPPSSYVLGHKTHKEVLIVSAYEDTGIYNSLKVIEVHNPYQLILANKYAVSPEKLLPYMNITDSGISNTERIVESLDMVHHGFNPDLPRIRVKPPYKLYTGDPDEEKSSDLRF